MALTLSDAQLQTVADELFLLRNPRPPKLPKPVSTTGALSLAAQLDPIGQDPRFKDLSIGVVDFTADRMNPGVWLHREDLPWRIASTSKINVLLAATQLREDVRKVKALGLVSTPEEFDQLFALPALWQLSNDSDIRKIAGNAPRISTIFDVSLAVPDFFGAPAIDRAKLFGISGQGNHHLDWAHAPDLTFWERMWLTGAESDNVAATSCVSEIGIDYLKSVQKACGLFAPVHGKGMCMMLSQGFADVRTSTPVNRNAGAPKYRALKNVESNFQVTDIYFDPRTHQNTRASGESGSVASLTAYMIALIQDKLSGGVAGSSTIRAHLADEKLDTTTSLIFEGVQELAGAAISRAITKLGILGSLRCEFAYLETAGKQYAVLAAGIRPKTVAGRRIKQTTLGRELGEAIHDAL
ncbi:MAG TPA: hypothetical protein VKB34_04355 [Povalibacter sp.]|nr:hypothetical protein [Povalibacter sp.]